MEKGAYAIGFSGGALEHFMDVCYLPGQVRRWDVPHNFGDYYWTGSRTLVVYRLNGTDRPAPAEPPPLTASRPIESQRASEIRR
jgi:hypothetical protein